MGRKQTEETKKKISRTLTGKPLSKEHKEKISKSKQGTKFSEEHKKKIRQSNLGKKRSKETCQRIREAVTGTKRRYYKRKPVTEETKKKISKAKKGNPLSEEHRENIGKSAKDFYKYLEANKKEFDAVFTDEDEELKSQGGRSHESKLIKTIKAIIKSPELIDDDEDYLNEILRLLREGGIAKATMKKIIKEVKDEINPLKILARIKAGISPNVFQGTFAKSAADISGPKEVILSEYLMRK